jgi:hypothetical protein
MAGRCSTLSILYTRLRNTRCRRQAPLRIGRHAGEVGGKGLNPSPSLRRSVSRVAQAPNPPDQTGGIIFSASPTSRDSTRLRMWIIARSRSGMLSRPRSRGRARTRALRARPVRRRALARATCAQTRPPSSAVKGQRPLDASRITGRANGLDLILVCRGFQPNACLIGRLKLSTIERQPTLSNTC